MEMLQLLNDYPLAAGVVKQWFINNMLEGLEDESLPEGFKEYVREQGIDDARVSEILRTNPRSAIDVFDDNEIYIDTTHIDGDFWFAVNSSVYHQKFPTRKDAEIAAIIEAFKLLNEKL
jgi:hypothetical protein